MQLGLGGVFGFQALEFAQLELEGDGPGRDVGERAG